MVRLTLSVLSLLVASACQKPEHSKPESTESDAGGSVAGMGAGGTLSRTAQTVAIQVSLIRKGTAGLHEGFGLVASATAFDISLEGCATGYTSTADEGSTALQVYKFDRGCKAKLTGFEYGGRTYIPTVADPFTTWNAGDSALFDEAGFPGTNAITVNVISQLADPVSGTEAIVYQFSEIVKGADESILEATVGAAHTLTVDSQPPPSFTIHSVEFLGVTAAGAGQFRFTMECTTALVVDECENVDMADLTYKLVQDTYADTMNIAEANALFPAGETAVTLPGDRTAPGGVTTNGGFISATIDGPNAMATNPNMIFIIQANNTSYQYFNVDVATLTQD